MSWWSLAVKALSASQDFSLVQIGQEFLLGRREAPPSQPQLPSCNIGGGGRLGNGSSDQVGFERCLCSSKSHTEGGFQIAPMP